MFLSILKNTPQLDKENLLGVLGDLPLAILGLDGNGNCVYANSKFESLAFLSPGSAIGIGWEANKHQYSSEGLLIEDANILTFCSPTQTTTVRLSPFKRVRDVQFYTVVEVSSSIYNKHTVGEEIQLLQNMLDFTDALLYSSDIKGNIIAFNDSAS